VEIEVYNEPVTKSWRPGEKTPAIMGKLYLLRHAKAVPQSAGRPDRDRPIEKRGREDASALARWIADHELRADLILCSPARRTRETLELIVPAFRCAPEIRYEDALYLADADRLLGRLRDIPDRARRVMVVGHNPGLQELAQALSDADGKMADRLAANLPTTGLACFEIVVEWAALRRRAARLTALVTPKDVE
jgi:phosphohistidine phosphatase